jgi:hypothetical protein
MAIVTVDGKPKRIPDRQLAGIIAKLIRGAGELTTADIADRLRIAGYAPDTRLRAALGNAADMGLLVRVAPGVWSVK